MRRIILCIVLFLGCVSVKAQQRDYLSIRDSLKSVNTKNWIGALNDLDTFSFSKNIHLYYTDLGMAYYSLFEFPRDSAYLFQAVSNFQRALYHITMHDEAIQYMAMAYGLLGHCDEAKRFINLYKKIHPQSNIERVVPVNSICIQRNTVFLEVLGTAGLYSLNYEKLIRSEYKIKHAARIGFSYFDIHALDLASATVPLSYSILFPIAKRNHYLEIALGLEFSRSHYYSLDYTANYISNSFRLGYRYQKKMGGAFYNLGWTPSYLVYIDKRMDEVFYYGPLYAWAGFGVGYTFK